MKKLLTVLLLTVSLSSFSQNWTEQGINDSLELTVLDDIKIDAQHELFLVKLYDSLNDYTYQFRIPEATLAGTSTTNDILTYVIAQMVGTPRIVDTRPVYDITHNTVDVGKLLKDI